MRQVKSTKDYSLFYYIKGNRPLGPRVTKMIRAIKKRDLTKDCPILCSPPDRKNMRGILDGQARFEACKKLNKPIFFLDSEEVRASGARKRIARLGRIIRLEHEFCGEEHW